MNASIAALADVLGVRAGSPGRRDAASSFRPKSPDTRRRVCRSNCSPGAEEVIRLAVVVLAVVDADHAPADDQEAIALDDDRRRLVEPQAEQPRLRLDDLDQVVLAAPDQQVLVDGHAPEVAEPLLVALGHHDLVALAGAADQVRALDGRAGRRAADHPAAGQDALDLALGPRAHVGVDQPPLPAAAEPDAPGRLERGDERLRVGLGPVAGVQHGHVLHAELLGEPLAGSGSRSSGVRLRWPSGSARSRRRGRPPAPRTPGPPPGSGRRRRSRASRIAGRPRSRAGRAWPAMSTTSITRHGHEWPPTCQVIARWRARTYGRRATPRAGDAGA